MKHHHTFLLTGVVIYLLVFFFQTASGQYTIPQSIIGSGGNSMSSSNNLIISTLGQPFIGTAGDTSYNHTVGFWYTQRYILTAIEEKPGEQIPAVYQLYQNYPNPFNPSTTIRFDIPKASFVTLKIYNILGQEINTLVNGYKNPGRYEINFDASSLSSGVYFYRLTAGEYISTKKLLLAR